MTVMAVGDSDGETDNTGMLGSQHVARDKAQGKGKWATVRSSHCLGGPGREDLEFLTCATNPLPLLPPTTAKITPKCMSFLLTASSENNQPGHLF